VFPALVVAAAIAIIFGLLPMAWGLRAWALAGLPVIWAQTLRPVTPFQIEGPLDGLANAFVYWFFDLATLGVAGRAFWTLAQAPLDRASLSRGMREPDGVVSLLYGLVAGTVFILFIATAFRGMSGGLALHFAVAGCAAVGAVAALFLPLRMRVFTIAALATVACLAVAGGLYYPKLILTRADLILPEAQRCLRTPDGIEPTTDQLRLLTLPEARPRHPNLVLTVLTENGPKNFRWSYRSFGFRTYDSYADSPCLAS
jgi:hypothetical protein